MTALPSTGSFAMVDPTWVAAVGPAAAILYARISWRAQETGEWYASRRTLAQETGLTDAMLRTAVQTLRDHEWLRSRRASTDDATLVWAPVVPGQTDIADSAPPPAESTTPPCEIRTDPPAESAISSYETSKTFGGAQLSLVPEPDSTPAPPAAKAPRKACKLPADYVPKPAHFTLAQELGVDLRVEGPQFVDHHTAKGSVMKDWDAALRMWIRNAAKFAARRQGPPSLDAPPATWTTEAGSLQLPPPRTDPFAPRAGGWS